MAKRIKNLRVRGSLDVTDATLAGFPAAGGSGNVVVNPTTKALTSPTAADFYAANPPPGGSGSGSSGGSAGGALQLVSRVSLAAAGPILFAGIPQDGESLLLVAEVVSDRTDNNADTVRIRINGANQGANAGQDAFIASKVNGNLAGSSNFIQYRVNGYAKAGRSKAIFGQFRGVVQGVAAVASDAVYYTTADALSSIQLYLDSGDTFAAGSTAALYKYATTNAAGSGGASGGGGGGVLGQAHFNGMGGVSGLAAAGIISSVSRTGLGTYRVNLNGAPALYTVAVMPHDDATSPMTVFFTGARDATGFSFVTYNTQGPASRDSGNIDVTVFGSLS